MKIPRTDWIPLTTPPVRDGDYEFVYTGEIYGTAFSPICRAQYIERRWHDVSSRKWPLSGLNNDPENYNWRGLASDPNAK